MHSGGRFFGGSALFADAGAAVAVRTAADFAALGLEISFAHVCVWLVVFVKMEGKCTQGFE